MHENNTPLTEAQENEKLEIIEKGGRHTLENTHGVCAVSCGCTPETDGGNAYRDLVTEFENNDDNTVRKRYYHQSRVVTTVTSPEGDTKKLDINTHGFGDRPTTRERINKELPQGFRMVQRDYIPMLQLPSGDCIDVPKRFVLDFEQIGSGWVRVTNWNKTELVADVNLWA